MRIWIIYLVLFLWFAYLVWSLIFNGLIEFWYHDFYADGDVRYPRNRPEWVPKEGWLFDFHCHTQYSDGLLTPSQLIEWHISNGYDGLVITDHDNMEAVPELLQYAADHHPDFLIIPGVEFTTMRIHLNLIGIKTPMPQPNGVWTKKKTIIKAINHAHAEGGVIQFNHKDWYLHHRYLPPEWWVKHGIDGWEIYNGFNFIDEEALEFIERQKPQRVLFPSAGTDLHDPANHLRMYTEVITDDHTAEGFMTALKLGKTRVFSNVAAEKQRKRPEAGKRQKNPEKQTFIRKWWWLYWAGYAINYGKNRKLLLILLIASLIWDIWASFF